MEMEPTFTSSEVLTGVVVLLSSLVVAVLSGKGDRRTIVIKSDPQDIYDRMYRWFSLQDHEISQEVKNQKIQVKIGGQFAVYILIGLLLSLAAIIPGVVWFVCSRGRLTITLQSAPEGTYLSAHLQGMGAASTFNQLVGILSMLDTKNN